MKLFKKVLFVVLIAFCAMNMKCESNDEIIIDTDNLLLGSWEDPVYEANTITFKRAAGLAEDAYGVQFKAKGQLLQHTAGWGATPPLRLMSRSGKWEMIGNQTIAVTQQYFPNEYAWKIESLTHTELIVSRALTPQEEAQVQLVNTFEALEAEIKTEVCENGQDWSYVAYGAKACGGPQGFLAYPKAIDTTQFFSKVAAYTKAEQSYNETWSVFSTCEAIQSPKAVVCENGRPVLRF